MVAVVGVTPEHGIYQAYATTNGIDRTYIGPRFDRPRDAYRFADREERKHLHPSPLRSPVERQAVPGTSVLALSEEAERFPSVVP